MTRTRAYSMVDVTVRNTNQNETWEETATFYATDHIGISNFILYADEVIEYRTHTVYKTEKVSVWAWLRG